jgi:glycosyltransferase involved in cell wall biosynthesis
MVKVLYIVWWEGTFHNGLIRSQVYSLLGELASKTPVQLTLLSFGPFWRGCFLRRLSSIFPHSERLAQKAKRYLVPEVLADDLEQYGISYVRRQMAMAPKSIYLPFWVLLIFPWMHLWFLRNQIVKQRIDVIHCRSYIATLLAVLCRSVFRLHCRIVFDARGLLPEEGVATGWFRHGSLTDRLWNQIEKILVRAADQTVVVSNTFAQYWREKYKSERISVIPLCVNLDEISAVFDSVAVAETGNEKTLVYLGSISENGWHSPEYLAKLYRCFRQRYDQSRLLVITSEVEHVVRDALCKEGVESQELQIVSARNAKEVGRYLQKGTYGCLPLRRIRHTHDEKIAYTMLSTKFVEYLAAGLPVLSNCNIVGVVRLLEHERVGYAIDLDDNEACDEKAWIDPDDDPTLRMRCQQVARLFSHTCVANQYFALYQLCMHSDPGSECQKNE